MITLMVLPWVVGALILAMVLILIRLLRGPSVADRVLALDTLYVTAMALVIVLGIVENSPLYFEVALLIAMLGFFGTVVLARYLARGKVIE